MVPSQIPPAPAATEAEATFSPALVVRAVRKHWQIVVTVLVGCVVCAWLYTANQRNLYEAVATVQLDPQPLTPMGHTVAESGTDSYWSNQEYFATQYQVITSRRVAESVVRKLHLNTDGAFLSERVPGAAPAAQASPEDAAEVLRSRLKVAPITDSRL